MDCRFPYLVVATAAKEQGVHVYNLQGGPKPFKVRKDARIGMKLLSQLENDIVPPLSKTNLWIWMAHAETFKGPGQDGPVSFSWPIATDMCMYIRRACDSSLVQPNQPMITSQIKQWQTRSVCMFPDCSGFALGNIEGRVAIHYIDNRQGE